MNRTTVPCHCRKYSLGVSPDGVISFIHNASDKTMHTHLMCHNQAGEPRLNRKQLLDLLRGLQGDTGDKEVAHIEADEALLTYIDDIEVAQAFHDIDRWYA